MTAKLEKVRENMFNLPTRQKVTIMVAVMAGMLLAALDQTIVATAMPRIVTELNGFDQLSWVFTAYMLTMTITVPISGKLSDLFGRRVMLLGGIAVFVGGSMLSGLSQNMAMLIGFRALQGVGGGILMSNTIAVIGDLFAPAQRAKWQGMIGAVFGLSSVIGPLLGGWLTDHASWRWTFYINVPVGILAFALILALLPNMKHKVQKAIDYAGAALLAVGLGQLVLALSLGGKDFAWNSVQIIGLFIGAAVAIIFFLLNEYYIAKDPVLPLDLFKNRTFTLSSIVMFVFGIAMFSGMLYIPLFAQDVLGRSATNSGVIMLPMVLGMLISSIGSGQIVSRTGRYKLLAAVGMIGTTGALYWFSTLNIDSTQAQLNMMMFFGGLFIGVAMPIFNLIAQNAFNQSRLGVVSANIQLFRSLGSTVGVAIMGSFMNSELTKRLGDINSQPFLKSLAKAQPNMHLDNIDINKLQGLLSADTLNKIHQSITASVAHLPAMVRPTALAQANSQLDSFLHVAKVAIAGSVDQVFLLSAGIASVTIVAVLFLKEIPLRHGHETAEELAGAELAVEYGNFAAEDEPELVR
jgi:EmrB/QacA subfamily drug resistance transporter